MCTLVVLHRATPGVPLLVAANRDEFLARRSEGPALWRTPGGVAVVAPRDARGGGTWLGINSRGLFAALTNVAGEEPDPERRSRGLLVLDALETGSAEQAAALVQSSASGRYNPFNLFVADAREAWGVSCRGDARSLRLEPGAHVVGNAPLDAPPTPKVAQLRERAERLVGAALPAALAELAALCREHREGDPFASACVHTERYGTRSSALLALAYGEGESVFRFADGAPCRNEYEDFTPLLHQLSRGSRLGEGESLARELS
jgi:uncharacterized protein with NRDE domain